MSLIRCVLVMVVCIGFIAGPATAEFRPWSDTKGNTVEAEYVRIFDDTVVLRKRDGDEIKVPLESLMAADCTYAMLLNPPRIEITVKDGTDDETVGYKGGRRRSFSVRVEAVTAAVSLKKISTERYDGELTLDLFLIGQTVQLDRFAVLERESSKFIFTAENKGSYEFSCGPVDIRNMTGSLNSGVEYEGFLAIVRDSRDEVVAVKASRLEFEKNTETIQQSKKGDLFDQNFKRISGGKNDRRKASKKGSG